MKTAIALGTFDGVHQGHRAVLAETSGYNSVAVTFDIPPKAYNALAPSLIMMPCDKAAALKQLGVAKVDALDFPSVKNIPPREFLDALFAKYDVAKIVCGFNYRFGAAASGDAEQIRQYCQEHDARFSCVDAVSRDGQTISSTSIRALIESGDIKAANEFILGGFGFTATVQKGDRRGRELGFPTINQQYPQLLCVPLFGVYRSEAIIGGKHYKAITNLGHRPTFRTDGIFCETHIFDFAEDVYGQPVTLKLMEFVRQERKFGSADELKMQIEQDIKSACVKE